jgi:hypothetical protein
MHNDTLLIGFLAILAVLLGAMVFTSYTDNQADAAAPAFANGDYLMVTGARSDENDLVYVIDKRRERVVAYYVDGTMNKVTAMDSFSLATVFKK